MALSFLSSDAKAEEFEARQSPVGLLERYARGRVAYFRSRQALTLIGALTLAFLESPQVGLLAAALALVGEAVDCGLLSRVPRWRAEGRSLEWLRIVTTLSASFQALTIAACILLTLFNTAGLDVTFFAFAFLIGAATNAGVVLPYHPLAAQARLSIYLLTGMVYLLHDIASAGGFEPRHGYKVMGALLAAYTVRTFLRLVIGAHHAHVKSSRDLLQGAQALAQSNRNLEESQREARQLALVARHANDSVIVSDAAGRILWVNDAFVTMTGCSASEAVGQEIGALFNGPDTSPEAIEAIASASREGRPLRCEILNYTRDGRQIWVETNQVPIRDAEGRTEMVVAIERDVTAAKTHAMELTQAKLRAEEGARSKAAFLATMSHEIRTPMNGIIGMTDLLSESPLDPQQRECLEAINSSAEALLRIINDILDYSKLDAGKMKPVREPFNLGRCIRMSTDLLRGSARDKGLYLDVCHEVPLPESVIGDEGRVRQVLLNLLGNAIKFTEAGGVTLRIGAERKGATHAVRISVTDTGIGVADAQSARIFDQFEQADVASTRKFGGTGLGLAISRQLARRMGGDLVLKPTDAGGATFVFTFTAGVQGGEPQATGLAPAVGGVRDLTDVGILIAEDNRTNSLLISRYLSDLGASLWFARNGTEALEVVRAQAPDIVLMDISMPELDGISAARQIRSTEGPQPYIIALTANAFDSDRSACFAAGMNDFLAKPVRKAALLAALGQSRPVN